MQLALQVDRAGMIDFFVCQSIAEREKKKPFGPPPAYYLYKQGCGQGIDFFDEARILCGLLQFSSVQGS